MSNKHLQIAELLIDLEYALRRLDIWSAERPSEAALASEQPFCVDTLDFGEWLQFVFIERMSVLIEKELPLPTECGLAPMAEEYFHHSSRDPSLLIRHLEAIDRTLSG